MREAIGGTWIMGIVVVFIVLFTSFLAYSISYTKAFNVKNQIINYIEFKQGFTKNNDSDTVEAMSYDKLERQDSVEAQAYYMILQSGYNNAVAEKVVCSEGVNMPGGYCIKKVCQDGNKKSNVYYKVTTFIAVEIPIMSYVINIPISGETGTIYSVNDLDNMDCN